MLARMARIAIIGGGSMGEALLSGMLRAGRQVKDLVVAEKDPGRAKFLSETYSVLVTTVGDAVDGEFALNEVGTGLVRVESRCSAELSFAHQPGDRLAGSFGKLRRRRIERRGIVVCEREISRHSQ